MKTQENIGDLDEAGEATIEFIGLTILLVIPVFYFIVTLGYVQASVLAADAGARQAAQILSMTPEANTSAIKHIHLAFDDYSLPPPTAVHSSCIPSSCSGHGAIVKVSVETTVPLPLLPDWIAASAPIPIYAEAQAAIEDVIIHE